MNGDSPRLIEVAFPLKQASLDSVHEKNVRHGHISTLHIWPARRPLAACRAALVATLLPDPGNEPERRRLLEMLGGTVKTKNTFKNVNGRKVPVVQEFTEGGILHWGRENDAAMYSFREEIKKAYGGRAPRVLDPFAGGGAIPLEAMRLGCEVTAADINPVAWFILKCTLEYPQRLAGQKRPLPSFAPTLDSLTLHPSPRGRGKRKGSGESLLLWHDGRQAGVRADGDLADHVRAWGQWVLERARRDLEGFYPTVDGKPTVAYLWARTVTCKNCRATIPLLKTLWLCRKEKKRVRLAMKPRADRSGVDFEVVTEPEKGGNLAQRRAHDDQISRGTMSRSGAWCPVCGGPGTVAMTMADIRAEGMAGRPSTSLGTGLGAQMTAVVVHNPSPSGRGQGEGGKDYRLPTPAELQAAVEASAHVDEVFKDIPFGLPMEPTPRGGGSGAGRAFSVQNYGMDQWHKLFTPRQLLALGTFVKHTRAARDAMRTEGYPEEWVEALSAYLAILTDRAADRGSTQCVWICTNAEKPAGSFGRFALPITWDFVEIMPWTDTAGGLPGSLDHICEYIQHALAAAHGPSRACRSSASQCCSQHVDVIVTDPPYYDAIPYSDLMDFFYVWLRRTLHKSSPELDGAFSDKLGPKWDRGADDGELIDDASRFDGDAKGSRQNYEDGMCRAFGACHQALQPEGRLVVVFASKQPEAWETLASAIIRAGFVVDGSWPIQTERGGRLRAQTSAALSSSVWLVCRKRPEAARPGWDNQVLEEMRSNIGTRLRQFWDAGIRGPDFVWAATGPALEAYSKHPVVKKADRPGELLTVSEFLKQVRRIVVDYVVGKVLAANGNGQGAEGLDDVTLYYLLHRHHFGLQEAPAGACILYAQSCNVRDRDLADRHDLLAYGKGKPAVSEVEADEGEETDEDMEEEPSPSIPLPRGEGRSAPLSLGEGRPAGQGEGSPTSGSMVKLKRWEQRQRKDLGLGAGGRPAPLIDQVHRLMHLWRAGDVQKVDGYLEDQGLRRNPVFPRLLQALIELAGKDNQPEERVLLESVMNRVTARGAHPQMRLMDTEEQKWRRP